MNGWPEQVVTHNSAFLAVAMRALEILSVICQGGGHREPTATAASTYDQREGRGSTGFFASERLATCPEKPLAS